MTADELTATLAKINELETEAVNAREGVQQAIQAARKLNEATRAGQSKLYAISEALTPLKAAVAKHNEEESIARKKAAAEEAAKAKE